MTTVTLASLNAADKASFVAALGDIYEHAPWVAEAVHGRRPFASLAALHEAHCSRDIPTLPARRRAPAP